MSIDAEATDEVDAAAREAEATPPPGARDASSPTSTPTIPAHLRQQGEAAFDLRAAQGRRRRRRRRVPALMTSPRLAFASTTHARTAGDPDAASRRSTTRLQDARCAATTRASSSSARTSARRAACSCATEGLTKEFGAERCFDTPLSEDGIVGAAIGMALNGLKPVAEIQFQDFIFPAFDQIVSEAAKFRYRSGGQYTVPMVIRTPYGGGIRGGLYHSQSGEAYFCHTPGLKVVDALDAATTPRGCCSPRSQDPDPVLFLEPKALYRSVKGEVPEGDYTRGPLDAAHGARRLGRHGLLLRRDGAGLREGGREGGREGHRLRWWSTCARCCRSTRKACSRPPSRPAAWSVVHEAPRFCGFGGRDQRARRRERDRVHGGARSCA